MPKATPTDVQGSRVIVNIGYTGYLRKNYWEGFIMLKLSDHPEDIILAILSSCDVVTILRFEQVR